MKKQVITSFALLALATPLVAVTNIQTEADTKVDSNPTELNIKIKDITEDLNRARDVLLQHTDNNYNSSLWTYKFEDVIIAIPEIDMLYLNDTNLSYDSNKDDDHYRVGLEMDINLEQSISWNGIEESTIINKKDFPLYLDYVNYNFKWCDKGNTSMLQREGEESGQEEEWTYDLDSIWSFLDTQHDFTGYEYYEIKSVVDNYIAKVTPFVINGTATWKDMTNTDPEIMIEYQKSVEILDLSWNKISVYGQRYDASYGLPPESSLFDNNYLLMEDIFERPIIIETPTPDQTNSSLSSGAIAGIVVGLIAGVALIGGTIFGITKLKK